MKKIVIDARTIDTSTGFYTQNLLYFLNKDHAGEFAFVVLVPRKSLRQWSEAYPKLAVRAADEKSYSVAEQTSFVAKLESFQPDLVHFTMPQQPFLWLKPAVTTIHDLTLVRFDNIDMNRIVYKMKKSVFISLLRAVIMRSRAIITPTQFVKDDIISYMGKRYTDKIHVTHEAGNPVGVKPKAITEFKNKQFITAIGNMFPYKNFRRTILAYAELKKSYPDLLLLIPGKKDYFTAELEAFIREKGIEGVHFLGFISPEEKSWILRNCLAYVSASLSEGFNISLVEAFQEGAPAIVSDASCHREVGGDAALYFDPYSTEDAVKKLTSVIKSKKTRDQLIAKGHERLKAFSWQRMADETIAIYRESLK